MITLFGNLESGNVHKVQMILHRVGIPFRRVDVSQTKNETSSPEFLSINPIGKIPAILFENGELLTESGAILFLFAQNTTLWPDDSRSQAEVLRWMFFEQYSHEPALAVIRYLKQFAPNAIEHPNQLIELEQKGRHALNVLEKQLEQNTWLVKANCTIADYALYPYTRLSDEAGFNLDLFPNIQKWLSEIESQPYFISVGTDGADENIDFEQYFNK